MNGWKFADKNGCDHYTHTVNYRAHIGKVLIHPSPDTSKDACGEGYHLGKTIRGAGEYGVPDTVFKCSYSRKDVLGEDEHKVRVSKLTVLEERSNWIGYGPRGKQVLAFIESLKDIPWFANVGKPYERPPWAQKLVVVDSWAQAGSQARSQARSQAWSQVGSQAWSQAWSQVWDDCGYCALEIIGGIKDGYFSHLMEVYRAGHYPCSFDGKTLVVY